MWCCGGGDGLPFVHMANDLGEPRPRVVHGILEVHTDKPPYQFHKSGRARDGGEGRWRLDRTARRVQAAASAMSVSIKPRSASTARFLHENRA